MSLCLKCGGQTKRHDINDHLHSSDDVESYVCISSHENNDEIWHVCSECNAYHLECPKCHNYCRLTGFPGEMKDVDDEDNDGKQYYIAETSFVPFEGDYYEEFPEGCVSIPADYPLYFLDCSKWYPTGIDGSKFNRWECKPCGYVTTCYD